MREIAKRVSLRLDSTEYAHLKQLSMDTGLKMEPVIRRLIVGAELRPRPPGELTELLRQVCDMTPAGIIRKLDLRKPIYSSTAAKGHFGVPGKIWEETDIAEELRHLAGI